MAGGGVGLAPYHEADASIPNDVKALMDYLRMKIIDGSIDPLGPCLWYKVFLPLDIKQYTPTQQAHRTS